MRSYQGSPPSTGKPPLMMNLLRSVDDWERASGAERATVANALVDSLGEAWRLESSGAETQAACLVHTPTAATFVVVPGGEMTMGLGKAELELLDLYLGRRNHVVEQVQSVQRYAEPTCGVRVAPFLCGQRLLTKQDIDNWSTYAGPDPLGAVHRNHALRVANSAGFRLPSDAELEWLARQGRQATFVLDCVYEAPEDDEDHVLITDQPILPRLGIADLFETQWAADDWFDSHQNRPHHAASRTGGSPDGVRRFEDFYFEAVGRESVISQLSARRDPGRGWRARVRFALDLPTVV